MKAKSFTNKKSFTKNAMFMTLAVLWCLCPNEAGAMQENDPNAIALKAVEEKNFNKFRDIFQETNVKWGLNVLDAILQLPESSEKNSFRNRALGLYGFENNLDQWMNQAIQGGHVGIFKEVCNKLWEKMNERQKLDLCFKVVNANQSDMLNYLVETKGYSVPEKTQTESSFSESVAKIAASGDTNKMKLLLKAGVKPEKSYMPSSSSESLFKVYIPLIAALNAGKFEMAKLLVENGALTPTIADNYTCVDVFLAPKNYEFFKWLVNAEKFKIPERLNEYSNVVYNPLIEAAKTGNVDTVKLFLKAGAKLGKAFNMLEFNSKLIQVPLLVALDAGQYEMAKFLVEKGALEAQKVMGNQNCLKTFLEPKNHEFFKWLVDEGGYKIPLSLQTYSYSTDYLVLYLTHIAKSGNLEQMKLLLKAGVQLDKAFNISDMKQIPLLAAINAGKLEMAKLLVENGALTPAIADNLSCLSVFLSNGNNDFLQWLVDNDKFKIPPQNQGYSSVYNPLVKAAASGDLERMKLLLKAGAQLDKAYSIGETGKDVPLLAALNAGKFEMAKLLIDNGALTETLTANEKFPRIIMKENQTALKFMAENGLKIPVRVQNGVYFASDLAKIAASGNVEKMKIMLEAGVDPSKAYNEHNQATEQDYIPLITALYANKIEMAKLLVENGASPNIAGGLAALIVTKANTQKYNSEGIDYSGVANNIINLGADLNRIVKLYGSGINVMEHWRNNFSPLIAAAYAGNVDIGVRLVKLGADINAKDDRKDAVSVLANKLKNKSLYNAIDDIEANDLKYPSQVKEAGCYDYLANNNQNLTQAEDLVSETAAALSLHVLLGGTSSPWGLSKDTKANENQARTMVQAIAHIAKVGNDDAMRNLLWADCHKLQSEEFVKTRNHKLGVYLLYKHAQNKQPALADVQQLGIKNEEELNRYDEIAKNRYGKYLELEIAN